MSPKEPSAKRGALQAEPRRVVEQLARRRRDPERGVVEERDLAVRVAQRRQEAQERGQPLRQLSAQRVALRQHVHEVEQPLGQQRVVHRRALEVAAVVQELLRQLAPQHGAAEPPPARRCRALEARAEEAEREGVLEEVVAPEVVLERVGQAVALPLDRREHARAVRLARAAASGRATAPSAAAAGSSG